MDDSVRFLWSAAAHLSNSTPALQFLKAHYAEKAIALAGGSSDFPENFQSVSSMCPYCSSLWSTGASKLSLKSSLKTRRCTRNFIRKHYRNKKSSRLNAKLRRISRRLALLYFNSVQLTCNVCKGVTRIPLVRSSKKKGKADQEEKPQNSSAKRFPNSPLANPPPKKKKKKKDPFAGLNREAILAVQKRPPQKLEESIQRPSIGKLATILKKKASISGSKLDSMLK